MTSNHPKLVKIFLLIITLLSYHISCFKIIECGNSNTKKIQATKNNKNVVQFSDPIRIDASERIDLWCETDCWFSKCILTHQPNNVDGCESSEEPYESEKREVLSEFENSKRHICKFEIEKDFSCQGMFW